MLVVIFLGWIILLWSALGCYALRDFSYSRLETLCEASGQTDRFRDVLRRQEMAQLVLETVLTISTAAVGVAYVTHLDSWFGVDSGSGGYLVAFSLLFAVVLVADFIPWTVSRVASEKFLFWSWPLIVILINFATPLLLIAKGIDRLTHRMAGRGDPAEDEASMIDDEIRTVVDEGQREGLLGTSEGLMIHRVMELQDENVRAIMTPRTAMCCLDVDSTLEEAREQLVEWGHSRLPVIGESTDEILGLLYAKDLLEALAPRPPEQPYPSLQDILREPLYIPITTEIPSLLELMKRKKVQIAIVHDEYGGVAGLVTMEDIVEEIVGEIADEYDDDETPDQELQKLGEGLYEIDAALHLDHLNEVCDFNLPEDGEFETIGGFTFSLLGRLPSPGETVDWDGLRFTVLHVDRRKISRLRIERIVPEPPANANGNGNSVLPAEEKAEGDAVKGG